MQRNNNNYIIFTSNWISKYKISINEVPIWLTYGMLKSIYLEEIKQFPAVEPYSLPNSAAAKDVRSKILENSIVSYNFAATWVKIQSLFIILQYEEQNNNLSHNTMFFDLLDMVEFSLVFHDARGVFNLSYAMNFPKKDYTIDCCILLEAALEDIEIKTECLVYYALFGSIYSITFLNLTIQQPQKHDDRIPIEAKEQTSQSASVLFRSGGEIRQ